MRKILAIVLLLTAWGAYANSDLAFADSCYAARAERANGEKADAQNATLMKDAYRRAMQDPSVLERRPKATSRATISHSASCLSARTNAASIWIP